MDWQFNIGIGLAVIFFLLQYMVKNMSPYITWPGMSIGILFVLWGVRQKLLSSNCKIPPGPILLFIICMAGIIISILWFKKSMILPIVESHTAVTSSTTSISQTEHSQPTVKEKTTDEIAKHQRPITVDISVGRDKILHIKNCGGDVSDIAIFATIYHAKAHMSADGFKILFAPGLEEDFEK
ncbi:MAG: hypothetical protein HQL08_08745 [Nitrospirae bacterium]|nr:hypothetical protein [Nitrospirota bacterium]